MGIPGLAVADIQDGVVAVFDVADWYYFGLGTGRMQKVVAHPRLLRAMSWGDEDYAEHANDLIAETLENEANAGFLLEIGALVQWLETNAPTALAELRKAQLRNPNSKSKGRGVLLFARGTIEVFSRQDWLRLGTLANCRTEILSHDRLLRSLDFGDDDYAGHATEMVWRILNRQDDNYKLFRRFPKFLEWFSSENLAAFQRLFPEDMATDPMSTAEVPNVKLPAPTTAPTAPFLGTSRQPVPPPLVLPPDAGRLPVSQEDPVQRLHRLLNAVTIISPGKPGATAFHHAIEKLLSALLEGELFDPEVEDKLHGGLKRVDITYTNRAREGFFEWLARHYPPCQNIFVECKNYSSDLKNPDVDQLAGRFSDQRGRFGILVCRTVEDRDRVHERCKAQFHDNKNYIVVLEDADFADLVGAIATEGRSDACFQLLKERLDSLVK